tara:strand:- start:10516 stop:11694 length:1179 start_codon:yes stop_codon:yes gene_type:complete
LIELSRALGTYGTAAHRLEETITICASELGLQCHVFSTPTSVFLSVEHEGSYSTYLSRIIPGEVNLGKLRQFDELFNAVLEGRLAPMAAVRKIKEIVHEPDTVPGRVDVLCIMVIAACASVFLGGGINELISASIIGGVIGMLGHVAAKNREHARLIEFLAGLISALIAWSMGQVLGPYAPGLAMIAGIIVFMPGMTLTMSMTELATRHVVSGSARLVGALMILLLIGFGAAIGNQGAHVLFELPDSVEPVALGTQWKVLAAFVSSLLFVVLFRARWSDAWGMILAVLVSYSSSRFGVTEFGLQFGVCFAACCVGVLGNLYARVMDRPAATILLPGLLMMVPGSMGFKSLQMFMDQNTVSGMQSAVTVMVIGAGLVVGLLLANVLMPPRKVL